MPPIPERMQCYACRERRDGQHPVKGEQHANWPQMEPAGRVVTQSANREGPGLGSDDLKFPIFHQLYCPAGACRTP
jgi:hypothetical protein